MLPIGHPRSLTSTSARVTLIVLPEIIKIDPKGAEARDAVEAEVAMLLVEEEILVGKNPSKITMEKENSIKMTLMDQTFHIVTLLWNSMQH